MRSIAASIVKLSFYGASEANTYDPESLHGISPAERSFPSSTGADPWAEAKMKQQRKTSFYGAIRAVQVKRSIEFS